jgi:lipopolysaccharide assembly protein B
MGPLDYATALLLPVATATGWWYARKHNLGVNLKQKAMSLLRGLNYLVNEQPERAMEVFMRYNSRDPSAVDIQIALGSLYRRRGDVTRAIQIHQDVLELPSLSRDQQGFVFLALAEDYLRAGLLDRAETLCRELIRLNVHQIDAYSFLLDIYQQLHDWGRAIDVVEQLERLGVSNLRHQAAHFHCEKAESAMQSDQWHEANDQLRISLACDPNCVRASLLLGDLMAKQGNLAQALHEYLRIESQDFDLFIEALDRIQHCYEQLGRIDQFVQFLETLVERTHHSRPTLLLYDILRVQRSEAEAHDALVHAMARHPTLRGGERLLTEQKGLDAATIKTFQVLNQLLQALLRERPRYQCSHCGFSGQLMHWQCRGCKRWGGIRPRYGLES